MTTCGINAINPALYARMPFDPIKDLAPVVALVSLSNVLAVHPSVKANSVVELTALARAEPGKMTYASSGSGTSIHMSAEMFNCQHARTDGRDEQGRDRALGSDRQGVGREGRLSGTTPTRSVRRASGKLPTSGKPSTVVAFPSVGSLQCAGERRPITQPAR